MTTKTDQRAAERLLKRAVEGAVRDLRAEHVAPAPNFGWLRRRNEERFQLAIRAAVLFVEERE